MYTLYHNENGPDIGTAGAPVLKIDGLYFKNLSRSGKLEPYEDWRLPPHERARDLASRLSIEDIAGLMIYSPHQMVPAVPGGPFAPSTYGGKLFPESGCAPWSLTDQQIAMLRDDHLRHVLALKLKDAEVAARWSNELQAYAESLPFGIPVNISSDPRHGAGSADEEYKSGAAYTSKWPEGLGIAASFSPEACRAYAQIISKEYRAMGITTALSPQIDVATEPRWMRFEDTFGMSPQMVRDMGRAYCDGLQTTEGEPDGWGQCSVVAMAKHWPGGAPCEGGRDAHYAYGKFAVYPGKNLKAHMMPFLDGAFRLNGPTRCVGAAMSYYSISDGLDKEHTVGNAYSRYIMKDLLRDKYGYDGIVCTDWGITDDPTPEMDSFTSRCFGTETLSVAERHLMIIENGIDQFGGNAQIGPILEAYALGCARHGEAAMRARMERTAVRLLTSTFRCGLFENPYLDPQESRALVGCRAHSEAGFAAQLASIVLLKNKDVLPIRERVKVYIPDRTIRARKGFFRNPLPEMHMHGADRERIETYFDWVDTPEEADCALVFAESPLSDGYLKEERERTGSGYLPITLQYRPYTAVNARETSIAGGDFRETNANRSYRGKTNTAANERDLDNVIETKKRLGSKPLILCMRVHNPPVLAEMEPYCDAILCEFGVQLDALMHIVTGRAEPCAHLPLRMPRDMDTVEAHCEDVPFDYAPYIDSEGHAYDFGYGMTWRGAETIPYNG